MTSRTLVIGFGNLYRRDDGVGAAVVNALRRHLGRAPLSLDDEGMDDLGHPIDTLIVHQLVPELAETVAGYELAIFVDAHMGNLPETIWEETLEACYRPATVSHLMHPCTLLALAEQLYGRKPRGILLSVRGYDFDFGEGLSPQAAAAVPLAVERILTLAGYEGHNARALGD